MKNTLSDRLSYAVKTICGDDTAYQTTQAPEVALALQKLIPQSKLIIRSRIWDEKGIQYHKGLNHVAIEHEGEAYDSLGAGVKTRPLRGPYQGETNLSTPWRDAVPAALRAAVWANDHREIDTKLVDDLYMAIKFMMKVTHPDPNRRIHIHGTEGNEIESKFANPENLGPHIGTLVEVVNHAISGQVRDAKLHAFRLTTKNPILLPDTNWEDIDTVREVTQLPERSFAGIQENLRQQGYDCIAYDQPIKFPTPWPVDHRCFIPLRAAIVRPVNIPECTLLTTEVFLRAAKGNSASLYKGHHFTLHRDKEPEPEEEMEMA